MQGAKLPPGWRNGDEKRQQLAGGLQATRRPDPDEDDPLRAAKGIATWMLMSFVFWVIVARIIWLIRR